MAKLPDPSLINRKSPSPGGPAGFIQAPHIGTPGADTSIGDALSGLGEEAYKFMMREKARMDDVAIDDAKNQYIQQAIGLEGEYGKIRGKNAVDTDIVKDYTVKLDGVNEKISSGFKNDSQKRAWDKYYGQSKVRFTAGIMKHKLNESDNYAAETYKSTNMTRVQNAHSNWSDPGVVNNSAADIVSNIAKEKIRAGWGDERTEVELKAALGPLWSGVAAQYINAKQYKMAKKILDQNQEVIGVDKYTQYHKSIEASEIIDLSQGQADNIMMTVSGKAKQIEAARAIKNPQVRDETVKRVKIRHNEERIIKQDNEKAQNDHDIKWISEFGMTALGKKVLTVDMVKSAGLSDEQEAIWLGKAYSQTENETTKSKVENTNNTYADLLVKVTNNPDEWNALKLSKFVNPNEGGLTGGQYQNLVNLSTSLNVNTPKTAASEAVVKGNELLKTMYEHGTFGPVKTGKKKFKSDSWSMYSGITMEYQQKIVDEPKVDHTKWLKEAIDTKQQEKLYEDLDNGFGWQGPGIVRKHYANKGIALTKIEVETVLNKYKEAKTGVAPDMKDDGTMSFKMPPDNTKLDDPAGIY